jgi:hypothetical protein
MEDALFYQGGARHLRRHNLEEILIDFFDVSLYNKLKLKFEKPKRKDIKFTSNEDFWKHVIKNKAHIDQYVSLSNFFLTEWLPMSPGLFHTEEAIENRRYASRYIVRDDYRQHIKDLPLLKKSIKLKGESIQHRVAVELDPHGKMNMIQGGIGSLRLQPKKLFNDERMFLFGASSTGICHEGIPIILPSHLYRKIISQIKDDCGLKCNLIGTLQLLPTEGLPIKYNRTIPKYCLFVEDISEIKSSKPEDILISIAITYSKSLRELRHKEWSFVSFNPDNTDRQLMYSVEWLHDYARRYSHVDKPIVLSDFDEFRQHFDKVEFNIKDVANGTLDLAKLAEYEEFLEFKIINVMGDYFNNISNATIVNKSVVQNAFNKVKETIDEETAAALAHIAEHVEKSGNKEAGEVFNAFTEELQKPEPKKSLLKSFWTGLTTVLPTVSTVAGIAEKVIKMIG